MFIRINGNQVTYPTPMYAGQKIVVAIDSSKTNSALAIGDATGRLTDYIELNGSADGTSLEDTLTLCWNERKTLEVLFKDAKPMMVGIENIITKVDTSRKTGMTEHMSRFKITAVFMSFISFFQDTFGVTAKLINNQEWKSHVLPEEFRKHGVGKGSLAYFKSIGSRYQYCTDDVTDAICILRYMTQKYNICRNYEVQAPEISRTRHTLYLMTEDFRLKDVDEVKFAYNTTMGIEDNANVMSNFLIGSREKIAVADVNVRDLKLSDIYKYCSGKFKQAESTLKLVVVNGV